MELERRQEMRFGMCALSHESRQPPRHERQQCEQRGKNGSGDDLAERMPSTIDARPSLHRQ